MGQDTFDVGSGLAVPGLEATIEYGDASTVERDRIPGAMLINDRSGQEWARVANFDGLHGDPDGRDARDVKADQDGENAGIMRYSGRTIGLTGTVEAGSITAMRDIVTRFFSQFGKRERDLLIHPHSETATIVNHVRCPEPGEWIGSGGSLDLPTTSFWAAAASVAVDLGASASGTSGAEEVFGVLGEVSGAVADGDGVVMRMYPTDETGSGSLVEWNGEDLYIAALVSIPFASATPLAVSVSFYDYDDDDRPVVVATKSSPSVGTSFYWLSGRVDASLIPITTRHVGMSIDLTAPNGDYLFIASRAMLVLLDHDDPTPVGYFSGELPGYGYEGIPRASKSRGPMYAVNLISDPQCLDEVGVVPTSWSAYTTGGGTAPTVRFLNTGVTGSRSGRSVYFNGQKSVSAGASPLKLSLRARTGGTQWGLTSLVSKGRSYRFSALIDSIVQPTDGLFVFVEWYAGANTLISTSTAAVTDVDFSHTFVAPNDAVNAIVAIGNPATVEVGAVLEVIVSDACFVDVTDVDVGDFYGLGHGFEEVLQTGVYSGRRQAPTNARVISHGARRRVPRPFLIKSVRKTSDGKAPEQQQDRRYRRDYTMSLRASDPRIYVLDERTSQIRLSGQSKMVVRQAPDDFTLEGTGALATPTGYTSEGSYITVGGGTTPFRWSHDATNYDTAFGQPSTQLPRNGVAIKAWSSIGVFHNDPTQSLKARYYRSSEGFMYTSPRVVLGGAPISFGFAASTPPNDFRNMVHYETGSAGSKTYKYNDIRILLKRVSSTTWLELRWNSISHEGAAAISRVDEPSAPYGFELWCSHNVSGTLSTTKLASWDYQSTHDQLFPFRPLFDPMWLVSWMLNNIVYWELWSDYPNIIDSTDRVESGSYAIPSGLQSTIGTGVAGSSGWAMKIDSGTMDDGVFYDLASAPPYMHYFEESDANSAPASQSIPVIGSIETPQVITLRGDVIDPIVQITVPDFDDQSMTTSTARFSGTISDTDPIYVDLRDSSVRDRFGHNRRDLLVPGSRFEMLRPGINQVSLQAKSWGTYPSHLITSWRDALR